MWVGWSVCGWASQYVGRLVSMLVGESLFMSAIRFFICHSITQQACTKASRVVAKIRLSW